VRTVQLFLVRTAHPTEKKRHLKCKCELELNGPKEDCLHLFDPFFCRADRRPTGSTACIGTRPVSNKYGCACPGKTVKKINTMVEAIGPLPATEVDDYNPTEKKSIKQSMVSLQKAALLLLRIGPRSSSRHSRLRLVRRHG